MMSITLDEALNKDYSTYDDELMNIHIKTVDDMIISAGIFKEQKHIDSKIKYKYIVWFKNINDEGTGVRSFVFISTALSVHFLNGLYNHYEHIIAGFIKLYNNGIILDYPAIIKSLVFTQTFGHDNNCDDFIEEHKNDVFTRELMVEYFLRVTLRDTPDNEFKELAYNHCKMFDKNDDYFTDNGFDTYKMSAYLYPAFGFLTEKEFTFFDKVLDGARRYFVLGSIEQYKRFFKFYMIHCCEEIITNTVDTNNVLVKDFSVIDYDLPDVYNSSNFNYLYIKDDFINFLNNLTLAELYKVMKYSNHSKNCHNFILEANMILQCDDIKLVDKEYANIVNNKYNKYNPNLIYFNFDNSIRTNNYFMVRIFDKYSDNIDMKILNEKDYYNLLNLVNAPTTYINDECLVNWLFYTLSQLMNTSEIISLLISVSENFINTYNRFTVQQWLSYIDNYEEYKNMPVTWWINLV